MTQTMATAKQLAAQVKDLAKSAMLMRRRREISYFHDMHDFRTLDAIVRRTEKKAPGTQQVAEMQELRANLAVKFAEEYADMHGNTSSKAENVLLWTSGLSAIGAISAMMVLMAGWLIDGAKAPIWNNNQLNNTWTTISNSVVEAGVVMAGLAIFSAVAAGIPSMRAKAADKTYTRTTTCAVDFKK